MVRPTPVVKTVLEDTNTTNEQPQQRPEVLPAVTIPVTENVDEAMDNNQEAGDHGIHTFDTDNDVNEINHASLDDDAEDDLDIEGVQEVYDPASVLRDI